MAAGSAHPSTRTSDACCWRNYRRAASRWCSRIDRWEQHRKINCWSRSKGSSPSTSTPRSLERTGLRSASCRTVRPHPCCVQGALTATGTLTSTPVAARRWLRSDRGRGEGGASDLHLGGPRWLFAARSRPAFAATGSADEDQVAAAGTPGRSAAMGCALPTKGMRFLAKDGPARPRPRLRPRRGQPEVAKATCSLYQQPASEHIGIAVTALVACRVVFATARRSGWRRIGGVCGHPPPGAPLPSARPVGLRLLWLRIVCTNIWVTTKVYLLHLSWSLCFGAPTAASAAMGGSAPGRGGGRLGGRQCLVE